MIQQLVEKPLNQISLRATPWGFWRPNRIEQLAETHRAVYASRYVYDTVNSWQRNRRGDCQGKTADLMFTLQEAGWPADCMAAYVAAYIPPLGSKPKPLDYLSPTKRHAFAVIKVREIVGVTKLIIADPARPYIDFGFANLPYLDWWPKAVLP